MAVNSGFDLLSSETNQRELVEGLLDDGTVDNVDASSPIMHLIPGIFGDEPALASFRRSFNRMIRFELIEPADVEANSTILRSLEETGRCAALEIVRRQPTGDIVIVGYSFGGSVAFEAATHLLKMGRSIALLVVLDTPIYDKFGKVSSAAKSYNDDPQYAWLKGLIFKVFQFDNFRRALLFLANLSGRRNMLDLRQLLIRRFRTGASRSWRPAVLAVPTLIALSDEFGPWTRSEWTRLAPEAALIDLPGAHNEILSRASIAVLQPTLLKAILDRPDNA